MNRRVRWNMIALSVLKIAALAYLGLCLVLYLRQKGMVYYPLRALQATPADVGLAFSDLTLTTADGERIHGWFAPAEPARGTLLICHGNGGNIGDRLAPLQAFHALGLNVCLFDYRGYGRSTGAPSEEGTYQDALAVWTHLTQERGLPATSIVILGRSLGGAVAAWLAEREASAGLILESTFTSVPDMGARLYPYLPVRLLCRFRYNTLERIGRVRCPVLVAHSATDEMIPLAMGRRLYAAAPEPKTWVELTGGHNDGEGPPSDAYRRELETFLAACLRRQ